MPATHWSLFTDWCTARGLTPAVAVWDDVTRFLVECPTGPAATRARARAILTCRADQGAPLLAPPVRRHIDRAARTGRDWLTPQDALERCPVWGFPAGVTGRRDALIVAALNLTSITRHRLVTLPARSITPGAYPGEPWLISGHELPAGDYPERCPACRAWWWLQSLAEWENWGRTGARRSVTTRPTISGHLCHTRPPAGWEDTPTLTPRVDRNGWIEGPLTGRSLTRIMAARCAVTANPLSDADLTWPATPGTADGPATTGTRATMDGVSDTLDDLDAKIDALLAATITLATSEGIEARGAGYVRHLRP